MIDSYCPLRDKSAGWDRLGLGRGNFADFLNCGMPCPRLARSANRADEGATVRVSRMNKYLP